MAIIWLTHNSHHSALICSSSQVVLCVAVKGTGSAVYELAAVC